MKENRVLQFGPYPMNPDIVKGGIEASIFGLSNELRKEEGSSVKVINYPNKDLKEDQRNISGNLEILHIANSYGYDLFACLCSFKIFKEIKEFKPTVCHLHGSNIMVLILMLYLKLKGIKSIITVHGILTIEQYNTYKKNKSLKTIFQLGFYSLIEVLVICLSKHIIVDTSYVEEWIKKQPAIIRKPKCSVIPQGIDEVFFEIEDNIDQHLILSIGSISPRKGFEYSITAVEKIIKNHPRIQYHILGTLNDQGYYKRLQSQIKEAGLENNIFIFPDVNKKEVFKRLSQANVFILHSQEESQGIVFCEAMAAGKPIVATNVGGIPYVVKNGLNGLLSAFGDVESFSKNISTLLSSYSSRNVMSIANRKDSKDYSWSYIAKDISQVYATL